jgi:hypothetical protein
MSRTVDREVFRYCSETCPEVEGAFSDMRNDLLDMIAPCCRDDAEALIDATLNTVKKVGTEKLRDALREAVSDKQAAESERDELKNEVDSIKALVDDLERQVASLESELNEVAA